MMQEFDVPHTYDALLVLSFGGPEGPDDVMPFLRNVAGNRGIPEERLQQVAHHYHDFGGISPLNGHNRALIAALQRELEEHGPRLPIYFGNRNWHPFLAETMRQMQADGVRRSLVFVTSAFSSYSGCRQYLEDLDRTVAEVGAPGIAFDKLRVFYNHPGYIEPETERVRAAFEKFAPEERGDVKLVFTAHSVPMGMADNSDYVAQLMDASRLVADAVGVDRFDLVYQSRSGPPQSRWLEPDILDVLNQYHARGDDKIVIAPIGFISDHMEVLYDLDTEARMLAERLGMKMVRAETVGEHPRFVTMIRELILERMTPNPERLALGMRGPNHDLCPEGCCALGEQMRHVHAVR